MQKWYFTFGSGQVNQGKYVVIEATSEDLARKKMFDRFGSEWAFQYSESEWIDYYGISQAERYEYEELK